MKVLSTDEQIETTDFKFAGKLFAATAGTLTFAVYLIYLLTIASHYINPPIPKMIIDMSKPLKTADIKWPRGVAASFSPVIPESDIYTLESPVELTLKMHNGEEFRGIAQTLYIRDDHDWVISAIFQSSEMKLEDAYRYATQITLQYQQSS